MFWSLLVEHSKEGLEWSTFPAAGLKSQLPVSSLLPTAAVTVETGPLLNCLPDTPVSQPSLATTPSSSSSGSPRARGQGSPVPISECDPGVRGTGPHTLFIFSKTWFPSLLNGDKFPGEQDKRSDFMNQRAGEVGAQCRATSHPVQLLEHCVPVAHAHKWGVVADMHAHQVTYLCVPDRFSDLLIKATLRAKEGKGSH